MRSKLKNPITKEKLFDAAQTLVLAKGFAGTTVDDICKSAKLTKGSFFHYFKSKEDLGAELLMRYCATSKEAFLSGCCQKEQDPLKRIYGFLDFMIKHAKENGGKGCLLGGMAQELSDTNPQIRSICAKGFESMASALAQDLKEAKSTYKPRNAFDPQSVAEHFVVILEGTMLVSKVKNDSNKAQGLKHFKDYIKYLFMN